MSKLTRMLMGAGLALALSACGQNQNTAATQTPPPAPPVDQAAEAAKARIAQQDANVKVVEEFFKPGVSMDERMNIMSPDYVQHNPDFVRFMQLNNIQNGRDGFKAYVEALVKLHGGGPAFGPPPGPKSGPKPPEGNMFYKTTADGDLVTIVHERYLPNPFKKGDFYPAYSFDTFRVQDGKLAEHWDGATLQTTGPNAILLKEPVSKIHFPKQKKGATAD